MPCQMISSLMYPPFKLKAEESEIEERMEKLQDDVDVYHRTVARLSNFFLHSVLHFNF